MVSRRHGPEHQDSLALQLTAVAVQVDEDLRRMLVRPEAPRPKVVAVGVWPQAIPQFNLGHTALLQVHAPTACAAMAPACMAG